MILSNSRPRLAIAIAIAVACIGLVAGCASPGDDLRQARAAHDVVNRATVTIATLAEPGARPELRTALHDACAVLIFPHVATVDFVAGGSAGAGVLLVRDAASQHWVGPAFYSLDQLDVGAQVGIARREVVVVLHRCDGLAALEREGATFRLGTSWGMQASERGPGVDAAPGVEVFSRTDGVYVGLALRATAVRPDRRLSDAYYDRPLPIAEVLAPGRPCDEPSREIRLAVELAAR